MIRYQIDIKLTFYCEIFKHKFLTMLERDWEHREITQCWGNINSNVLKHTFRCFEAWNNLFLNINKTTDCAAHVFIDCFFSCFINNIGRYAKSMKKIEHWINVFLFLPWYVKGKSPSCYFKLLYRINQQNLSM